MDVTNKLKKEKNNLEKVVKSAEKRLLKLQPGRIHVAKKGKNHQYYYFSVTTGKWVYAKAEDMDRVKAIAQYEYESEVIKVLQRQINSIEKFISSYEQNALPC